MLWVACCTCFFGFLRSGEATVLSRSSYDPTVYLSITDISLDSAEDPRTVVVHMKASKTDPFRMGVTIFVGKDLDGLVPDVCAARLHLDERPGTRSTVSVRGRLPTHQDALVREVHQALTTAGLDPTPYSWHSFRIEAATTVAAAGMEDSVIKILGRWQSSAYQRYVQIPRDVDYTV